jgi:hypothetical protein
LFNTLLLSREVEVVLVVVVGMLMVRSVRESTSFWIVEVVKDWSFISFIIVNTCWWIIVLAVGRLNGILVVDG